MTFREIFRCEHGSVVEHDGRFEVVAPLDQEGHAQPHGQDEIDKAQRLVLDALLRDYERLRAKLSPPVLDAPDGIGYWRVTMHGISEVVKVTNRRGEFVVWTANELDDGLPRPMSVEQFSPAKWQRVIEPETP